MTRTEQLKQLCNQMAGALDMVDCCAIRQTEIEYTISHDVFQRSREALTAWAEFQKGVSHE